MKKQFKNIIPIIIVIIIGLIILATFLLSDKDLDINSSKITELYSYLGETDIYHCGGLNTYKNEAITLDNIKNEDALCMAYYQVKNSKDEAKKATNTNVNDNKTCKIGKSTTLIADEKTQKCAYKTFTKKDLNDAYNNLYNQDIKNYEKMFYISEEEACYLEGETYYCGTSETYTYYLCPNATIYRAITKAKEQLNGDIVIYDYFLRVSEDNKCYKTNDQDNENTDCTKALAKTKKVTKELLLDNGTMYKHIFHKTPSGYAWVKSEQK